MFFKRILFLSIFSYVLLPLANSMEIGFMGGMSSLNATYSASSTSTTTYSTKSYFQPFFGISYVQDFSPSLSFEIDGFYVKRKFDLNYSFIGGTGVSNLKSAAVQIPLIIRFDLLSKLLNAGLGAYYEFGTAGMDSVWSTSQGYSGSGKTYGDAGVRHNDFGLVGSIQFVIPVAANIGITLDGRYLFGLGEQLLSTAGGASMKNRYLQILGGFTLKI